MRVGDGGDRIYGFQFNEVNNEVTLRKSSKESEGGGGGEEEEEEQVLPLCPCGGGTPGAGFLGGGWGG